MKTKEEIDKLRKAAHLGDLCFAYICQLIHPGMTEKEIAEKMDGFFLQHGASGLSFETIVGAGKNSSLIHSTPSENVIQEKDIILLDFGCILEGYCSDTSRTIFIGGISAEEEKVYQLVRQAQENAIQHARIGMLGREIDALSRKSIQEAGYDFAHALRTWCRERSS